MRIVICFVIAGALATAALAASSGPRVRLLGFAPTAVSGSGFHGDERVVVTVSNGSVRLAKAVRTTAAGGFAARFVRALPTGGCNGFAISAVGSSGDRAAWKSPPRVCGAAPAP
jgi:hypothetical protein